jgi:hypothetical protein
MVNFGRRRFHCSTSLYRNNAWRNVSSEYLEKVEKIQEGLEKFPELYPISLYHEGLRRIVVNKQFSLLYQIDLSDVNILFVWDNRKSA